MKKFSDRREAGKLLASRLTTYANQNNVLVLGLPRGGIPVAFEVARSLNARLDVFIVRKLGTPGQPELAMGAVAANGVIVLNQDVVSTLQIPDRIIEREARYEQEVIQRQEQLYRKGQPQIDVQGKIVILVDDGLATGATMRAAVKAVEMQEPKKVITAVPVAAPSVCEEFNQLCDETVCYMTPDPLSAVGLWYEDFSQTSDDEVRELLREAHEFTLA